METDMEFHVTIIIFYRSAFFINLEQSKRSLTSNFEKRMPLSTNPTFEMEKLKKQASEVQQKLNGYTYEEVLLAMQSREASQRYVCQGQLPQIFVL